MCVDDGRERALAVRFREPGLDLGPVRRRVGHRLPAPTGRWIGDSEQLAHNGPTVSVECHGAGGAGRVAKFGDQSTVRREIGGDDIRRVVRNLVESSRRQVPDEQLGRRCDDLLYYDRSGIRVPSERNQLAIETVRFRC